jgi:hypothetical protein
MLHCLSLFQNRSCPLPCPCRLPKSCKASDITLDSLEVVEIDLNKGSSEVVEFVKQVYISVQRSCPEKSGNSLLH